MHADAEFDELIAGSHELHIIVGDLGDLVAVDAVRRLERPAAPDAGAVKKGVALVLVTHRAVQGEIIRGRRGGNASDPRPAERIKNILLRDDLKRLEAGLRRGGGSGIRVLRPGGAGGGQRQH